MYYKIKEIENIEIKSRALEEFLNFKLENNDFIIMFQIGDFFETFLEDAVTFSNITGATLCSRTFKGVGQVAQAGINIQYIDVYVKKLLNENAKVCICKQFKKDNGEIFHEITRKYTKGTIVENEFLDSGENNFLSCIVKNNNVYTLSYADSSTGQFYKTRGMYGEIQEELYKISPNELLILSEQKDLFKSIAAKFNTTYLKDEFQNLNPEDIILKYCAINQKGYSVELNELKEYRINSFMLMDNITRKSLELTRTRKDMKKKGSLLWFLNYTKTPMGMRVLKRILNEPLLNINDIKTRQNVIEKLIENKKDLIELDKTLDNFADLSRICAKLSNSTISPKDLYQISIGLDKILELIEITKKFSSNILKLDKKNVEKISNLASYIKNSIEPEILSDNKKHEYKIKYGYNSTLDYLKDKLSDVENKIEKYKSKQIKKYKIDNLEIIKIKGHGYFLEIPNNKTYLIDESFKKYQSNTKVTRYKTQDLSVLQEEIYSLKYKIIELEDEIYNDIKKQSSKFIQTIRTLTNEIAYIDVLASFAKCAIENNLTKPIFSEKDIIIKDGFHPSLIKLKNLITKNDTVLHDEEIIILTGANMSGKSTYLKHNAIICLLAQIGSFVPAKNANVSIVDKLFLRQGSTDDIINNNSSFMVEMNDINFILDNATKKSLILLDEPAKSTNSREGGAIVKALIEYILKYYKTKTIIITHNFEITTLEDKYPNNILNYSLGEASDEINDRKIRRGIAAHSKALATAKLAGLPDEIIENAKNYARP